ncbi:MAG: DJ-1/PfpI family protein [Lachnospiraceae bacterium]|nr:DJ-1/PfpI family protein [Lachnospiraceae bacterium]
MKECYLFLAEGFEEIEALTVVDILRRDNIVIKTVSITNRKEVAGAHGITVLADKLIKDIDIKDAALLILPGGMPGTNNLKECEELTDMLRQFGGTNRRIAAICAAPTILGALGLLEGRKACCYPGMESSLTGAQVCTDEVVTDGNITTSRGMGTAIPFALELVRLFDSQTEAMALKRKIVYNH